MYITTPLILLMKLLVALPILFFTFTTTAIAAPEIGLQVVKGRNAKEIDINISLSSSPLGCAFGVYASPRRAAIASVPDKSIRIATFHRDNTEIALRAFNITPVKRTKISGKFAYFRVLIDCGDEGISLSDSTRYRVPRRKLSGSKSIRHWIRRIKNMINFAELVP